MVMIACVDEKNGLMFNHRRQSRDSVVCRDILQECSGKKLYMSAYSSRLFAETEGTEAEEIGTEGTEITISEDAMNQAGEEDACFIEDTVITGFEERIQKVILYKWNRRYPADQYLALDLADGSWKLLQAVDFKGSSHEKITKEVYERAG